MCVSLPSLHLSLLFSRLQSQNFSMVHSLLRGCHCEECLLYVWHLWPFRNWCFYSCGCCKIWNTPHWPKLSSYGLSFIQGRNSEPAWLYNLIPGGFLTDFSIHKKRIRRGVSGSHRHNSICKLTFLVYKCQGNKLSHMSAESVMG